MRVEYDIVEMFEEKETTINDKLYIYASELALTPVKDASKKLRQFYLMRSLEVLK